MSATTPRTDSEITFTGAYTCANHNDQQRSACPVCLVTALTAERDQLRDQLAELHASFAGNVHTRCNELRADLAAEREKAERYRLASLKLDADLGTERARLDYLDLHMGTPRVADALNCEYGKAFPIRNAIDAAIRGDAK